MCIIIYNLLSTCHMTDTKLLIFILSFNLYNDACDPDYCHLFHAWRNLVWLATQGQSTWAVIQTHFDLTPPYTLLNTNPYSPCAKFLWSGTTFPHLAAWKTPTWPSKLKYNASSSVNSFPPMFLGNIHFPVLCFLVSDLPGLTSVSYVETWYSLFLLNCNSLEAVTRYFIFIFLEPATGLALTKQMTDSLDEPIMAPNYISH